MIQPLANLSILSLLADSVSEAQNYNEFRTALLKRLVLHLETEHFDVSLLPQDFPGAEGRIAELESILMSLRSKM